MNTSDLITPVILSGGSGTRLWPVSTADRPKQFLNLVGPLSLFQFTLQRCLQDNLFASPVVVGGASHAQLAEQQMDEVGVQAQAHILEPCARNTAPAIALAALACESPQTPMLVMPSDHLIKDVGVFQNAVRESLPLAKARWLVTFGIQPSGPETGYGYIRQGEAIFGSNNSYSAASFVEKPNRENAERMLDEGGHFWNAGIFLFRADCYLAALEEHNPAMLKAARGAMDKARHSGTEIRPDEASFANAPSDSIDYAVMEKAEKVAVTPVDPGWSDVGSWDSLYDVQVPDEHRNVITGDVVAVDSNGNLVQTDGISVATYGVEDMIIVANGGQVMVLPRGQSQNVKKILMEMNKDD